MLKYFQVSWCKHTAPQQLETKLCVSQETALGRFPRKKKRRKKKKNDGNDYEATCF